MIRHGRNVAIYVNGVDISGDLNAINPVSEQELADISTFGVVGHTSMPGLAKDSGNIEAIYNDTEKAIFEAMVQIVPSYAMMIAFGQAVRDPAYATNEVMLKNNAIKSIVTDVNRVSFSFDVDNYPFERGWLLSAGKQTVAAVSTGQGATCSTPAAITGSGAAYLQILQINSTSGTLTVSIQSSSSGAWAGEQVTTGTFAVASTTGTERINLAAGVGMSKVYQRAAWVDAGSTCQFALALVKY